MPRRLVMLTSALTAALLVASSRSDGHTPVEIQSGTTVFPGQPAPAPAPGAVGGQVPGAPVPEMPPSRDRRPGENERGTAAIRGQVVAADSGAPLRRAMVRASSLQGFANGLAQTDTEGRFEIAQLPAGRYTVSASRSGYVALQFGQKAANQPGMPIELADGQVVEKIAFALARGGAIAGRVVDELGEPIAAVDVRVLRFSFVNGARRLTGGGSDGAFDRTDDLGQFRLHGLSPGEYYVSASLRAMDFMGPGTVPSGPSDGFAPTYFPGTTSLTDARRVTVRAGQDTVGISFGLVSARLGRVSGRVTTSAGEPYAEGMLMIAPRTDEAYGGFNMSSAPIRPDGTFQTPGLAPGAYTLTLQPRGAFGGPPTGEVARLDITVNGDDIRDVFVVTGRAGIIRGRVASDDGSALSFNPRQMQLFPAPRDPSRQMMGMRPSTVRDDWTFELTGLIDAVRINATIAAPGSTWSVRHAWNVNVDLLDTGVDIGPGQVLDGVELIVSSKVTELSGLVTDTRNQAVSDASVVAFSEDPARWTMANRYVRTTRPDTNGKYTLRLTPSANYRVVVVRGLESGQSSDPEFLTRALEHATAFDIGEGEAKVLNLRLVEVR